MEIRQNKDIINNYYIFLTQQEREFLGVDIKDIISMKFKSVSSGSQINKWNINFDINTPRAIHKDLRKNDVMMQDYLITYWTANANYLEAIVFPDNLPGDWKDLDLLSKDIEPSCECGSDSAGFIGHTDYCPKYK